MKSFPLFIQKKKARNKIWIFSGQKLTLNVVLNYNVYGFLGEKKIERAWLKFDQITK